MPGYISNNANPNEFNSSVWGITLSPSYGKISKTKLLWNSGFRFNYRFGKARNQNQESSRIELGLGISSSLIKFIPLSEKIFYMPEGLLAFDFYHSKSQGNSIIDVPLFMNSYIGRIEIIPFSLGFNVSNRLILSLAVSRIMLTYERREEFYEGITEKSILNQFNINGYTSSFKTGILFKINNK